MVLYALGILVAVMAAILVKTTAIDNNGLTSSTASLTGFSPLTVAPIDNQLGDTGVPVPPLAPTATDSQLSPFPVIKWTATGLPPGITISRSSGLMTGTPTYAGTYQVTLTAKDNAHPPTYGATSFNWYIANMAPTITQIEPVVAQGAGGIRVVITGRQFFNASAVMFGDVSAGSVSVDRNGTRIVVYAPPQEAGTVNVSVTTPGGTSAPVPASQFTYEKPSIAVLMTTTGSTNGRTWVRIIGKGLAGTSSVLFGGVPSPYFVAHHGGTEVSTISPPDTPGTVSITVVTPGGVASTSGFDDFTYVTPVAPPAKAKHAATK
jgi:hypothetical protein